LIRSDVDDPESFEWAPQAQWFVEDTAQVDTLKIDPTVANITRVFGSCCLPSSNLSASARASLVSPSVRWIIARMART